MGGAYGGVSYALPKNKRGARGMYYKDMRALLMKIREDELCDQQNLRGNRSIFSRKAERPVGGGKF